MDDKLISLNTALDEVESIVDTMSVCISMDECKGMRRMTNNVLERLRELPPEVIVPVQHGRWIVHHEKLTFLTGEASSGGVLCSRCGWKTHNKMHVLLGCPFKYCPNCGADMRKDSDNNDIV